MKNFLLWAVAIVLLTGCGDKTHTSEWKQARDDAEQGAGYYCSLDATSIHSDEFLNCVDQRTDNEIKAWEREHPDQIWD